MKSKPFIDKIRDQNRLTLARALSKIENRDPVSRQIISDIFSYVGQAQVWGITGPPGAGKSSLVNHLIKTVRKKNKTIAVIAVDPSSPFSGGAVLGDRIRMQEHFSDDGVFIRSIGTRGHQGGLSHSTREAVLVLDAAGFDVILVETAGVGQTELDVMKLAQTVVVVLVPESGDSIQVMKSGLMEIADVFVVNKSDRPQADRLVRELVIMTQMGEHDSSEWKIPIHKTQGVKGVGVEEVAQSIEAHQENLKKSNKKERIYEEFLKAEILDILHEDLIENFNKLVSSESGKKILFDLKNKKIDPYQAFKLFKEKLV